MRSKISEWEIRSVCIFAAASFIVCMVLALPFFDTAMRGMMESFWGPFSEHLMFLTCIFLVCFVVESLILVLWSHTWIKWLLPVLSAALLIAAEGYWISGGWSDIVSLLLWYGSFPALMGACSAVMLQYVLMCGRAVKLAAVLAVLALVIAGIVFWPTPLEDQITLEPETEMLAYSRDGTREWMHFESQAEILSLVDHMYIAPCAIGPVWDSTGGVLLRLNEEYVLMAPHPADDPYIYRYSGPLEEFDGSQVCWRVYNRSVLHGNLTWTAQYGPGE